MTLALGDDHSHHTSIFRWYRKFPRVNFSLEDAEKTERPQKTVAEENITEVMERLTNISKRHTIKLRKLKTSMYLQFVRL